MHQHPIRMLLSAMTLLAISCGCTTGAPTADPPSPAPVASDESTAIRPSMNFTTKTWTSFDGESFPFLAWTSKSKKPRAVVVAVHGLNGSARDFESMAGKLSGIGVATFAYEMRGQGNDPEPKRVGDIQHTNDWKQDLATFIALVRTTHPDAPVFVFGESLGALITVHTLTSAPARCGELAGIMLSSPVVTLHGKIGIPKQLALQVGALFAPRMQVPFADFSGTPADKLMVTSEASLAKSSDQTPWMVSQFSLRFIAGVGRMINRMIPLAKDIETPTLVISGGKDVVMTPSDISRFIDALPAQLTTHNGYPDGHHLLLYDKVSTQVISDTCSWVNDQLQAMDAPERQAD